MDRRTERVGELQRLLGMTASEAEASIREEEITDAVVAAQDAYQTDLAKILEALGLGSHARPISCREVVATEVIPEIAKLKEGRPSCSADHCRLERARIQRRLLDQVADIEAGGVTTDDGTYAAPRSFYARTKAHALREFAATLE